MPDNDVDDIWAQMQSEDAKPRKQIDLAALQSKSKKKDPKKKKEIASQDGFMNQGWGDIISCPAQVVDTGAEEAPETLMDQFEKIPMSSPDEFLGYIQRDMNLLSESSLTVRANSLKKLHRAIVEHKDDLATDIIDGCLDELLKPLLKRLVDKSEKCRELSILILQSLVEQSTDISHALPYIIHVVVQRLGAEDIDGVAHLPEVMRPEPEQKPTEFLNPIETSEEVRLQLGKLVAATLARCSTMQVLSYVDEATGLLRAMCMDPYHEAKYSALIAMEAFCYNHHEILLHFTDPLARSLTSSLTHNHAKVRIASLRTLTAVLHCGVWKHNHGVIQYLIAHQDPNSVPIKAFYENITKVNYFCTLTFDRHAAVRRFWFETIAWWLLYIQDHHDHEPHLFPHLLSGLYDDNEDIQLQTFWLFERLGMEYEKEHEKDLRDEVQFGFDLEWTYGGRACVPFPLGGIWKSPLAATKRRFIASGPLTQASELDAEDGHDQSKRRDDGWEGEPLEIPSRSYAWPEFADHQYYNSAPRPRLGARYWVRNHIRRYIMATFNDVCDFRDCSALNAGRLLVFSIAYAEEKITEWLQPMSQALIKFYSGRAYQSGDGEVLKTYDCAARLTGAYVDPASYWEQCADAFDSKTHWSLDERASVITLLTRYIEGTITALESVQPPDPALGMGRLGCIIPSLVDAMHKSDLLISDYPKIKDCLWNLLLCIIRPLHEHLTGDVEMLSRLICVCLATAAAPAKQLKPDLVGAAIDDALELDVEAWNRKDDLLEIMDLLAPGATVKNDEHWWALPTLERLVDPLLKHAPLLRTCLGTMLDFAGEELALLRALSYLVPLPVMLPDVEDQYIAKLAEFASASQTPAIRLESTRLACYMARKAALCADRWCDGIPSELAAALQRFSMRLMDECVCPVLKDTSKQDHQAPPFVVFFFKRN